MNAKIRRDDCGDPVIAGKHGNIHTDGTGYSVAVMLNTARLWHAAKTKLTGFSILRQDGDTEGVVYLPALPNKKQATTLRHVLGVRKTTVMSASTLAARRKAIEKARKALSKRRPPNTGTTNSQ